MKIFEIATRTPKIITSRLEKYCSRYLNEIGGTEQALYKLPLLRGMGEFRFSSPMVRILVNQNRTPKDMNPEVQKMIDDWFEAKCGIRFRQQSLFCSGSPATANYYSADDVGPLVVVPIGEYHYTWSDKYRDLYDEINWAKNKIRGLNLVELLEEGNYQIDVGLQHAVSSRHEIMLACKQAYVLKFRDLINAN